MSKIVIISPHPDDESLGCGGTILKHKAQGDEVYWLIMTAMHREEGYDETAIQRRNREIAQVAEEYGFHNTFLLDYSTRKLDMLPIGHIIKEISDIIRVVTPNVVYIPFGNDVHTDHEVTFKATMSSLKTFRNPWIRKVLMYETISETEFAAPLQGNVFIPTYFVDISHFFEKKLSIISLYQGETQDRPFPRSIDNIKALATFRGSMAGFMFAEAFMLVKEVW